MDLADLKAKLANLSPEELRELHLRVRSSRMTAKDTGEKKVRKTKESGGKPAGKKNISPAVKLLKSTATPQTQEEAAALLKLLGL